MVAHAADPYWWLGEEGVHGQQFDGGDTEADQVVEDGGRRQPQIGATPLFGDVGMAGGVGADVQFVDHRLLPRRARPVVPGPGGGCRSPPTAVCGPASPRSTPHRTGCVRSRGGGSCRRCRRSAADPTGRAAACAGWRGARSGAATRRARGIRSAGPGGLPAPHRARRRTSCPAGRCGPRDPCRRSGRAGRGCRGVRAPRTGSRRRRGRRPEEKDRRRTGRRQDPPAARRVPVKGAEGARGTTRK